MLAGVHATGVHAVGEGRKVAASGGRQAGRGKPERHCSAPARQTPAVVPHPLLS